MTAGGSGQRGHRQFVRLTRRERRSRWRCPAWRRPIVASAVWSRIRRAIGQAPHARARCAWDPLAPAAPRPLRCAADAGAIGNACPPCGPVHAAAPALQRAIPAPSRDQRRAGLRRHRAPRAQLGRDLRHCRAVVDAPMNRLDRCGAASSVASCTAGGTHGCQARRRAPPTARPSRTFSCLDCHPQQMEQYSTSKALGLSPPPPPIHPRHLSEERVRTGKQDCKAGKVPPAGAGSEPPPDPNGSRFQCEKDQGRPHRRRPSTAFVRRVRADQGIGIVRRQDPVSRSRQRVAAGPEKLASRQDPQPRLVSEYARRPVVSRSESPVRTTAPEWPGADGPPIPRGMGTGRAAARFNGRVPRLTIHGGAAEPRRPRHQVGEDPGTTGAARSADRREPSARRRERRYHGTVRRPVRRDTANGGGGRAQADPPKRRKPGQARGGGSRPRTGRGGARASGIPPRGAVGAAGSRGRATDDLRGGPPHG